MRPLLLAVMLCGCGSGGSPELYALVFDVVMAPSSCFANAPATTVTGQLGTVNVEVWDGPDGKAYLSLEGGAITVDMGDAPTVTVTAGVALEGTAGPGGWTFATERTQVTTAVVPPIINSTTTTKTRAALSFPRASTAKGTLALASSIVCTGSGCPTNMPTCTIEGVNVRLTRLNVSYQKMP